VKIQKLTNGLIATLVLASPIVGAEDYPAANFQPKVIYSDSDYKHTESSASTTSSSQKAETSKPDAKYPAANFQPKVLFSSDDSSSQQTSEKPTTSSSSVAPVSKSSSSSESSSKSTTNNSVDVAEKDSGSMTTILGLIVLAVVGFTFFKQKSSSCPKRASAPTHRRVAPAPKKVGNGEGAPGVARDLNKNMPEMSSVAKYLQNKEKIPTSGVSKYVAKKVVAAKAAAVAKTTGVEKYLRNKG
jgi:cobalamin biosynthesis Mg chelatase CobN